MSNMNFTHNEHNTIFLTDLFQCDQLQFSDYVNQLSPAKVSLQLEDLARTGLLHDQSQYQLQQLSSVLGSSTSATIYIINLLACSAITPSLLSPNISFIHIIKTILKRHLIVSVL